MFERCVPLLGAVLAAACGLTAGAGDHVLRVDDAGRAGGDGSTWGAAFTFLQDALDAADADPNVTEIWIAQGRYAPDRGKSVMSGSRTTSFRLRNGVVLRGGYAGFGAPLPDVQDPDAFVTILTGDLAGDDGPDFAGTDENAHHVVTAPGADETAGLEDVVIEGGNADGPGTSGRGGGVYFEASSAFLSGCTVRACRAGAGGGLWVEDGAARFDELVVDGNHAVTAGGGFYLRAGAPDLLVAEVRGNAAVLGGGGYVEGTTAFVSSAVFVQNTAAFDGGGLYVEGSGGVYLECRWTGNSAGFDGGGAAFVGSDASIVDGRFIENAAARGGGAWTFAGTPIFSDARFQANVATELGGGLAAVGGAPRIAGGLWQGNAAPIGGGLGLEGTQAVVTDSDFELNTATDGGALAMLGDAAVLAGGSFVENTAGRSGGAASIQGGAPALMDVVFTGNIASGGFVRNGGAVSVTSEAAPFFERARFESNEGGFGGAIYAATSAPVFVDCDLVDNLGTVGGGVYCSAGSATFDQVRANGNRTTDGPTSVGGGIYGREAALTLTDCTFCANTTSVGGGGLALEASSADVRGGLFADNEAAGFGGGFFVDGGALTLDAVRVIGNRADRGGGVHGVLADLEAVNALFAGNAAIGSLATGGAIDAIAGTVRLVNTTIYANTSTVATGGVSGFEVELDNCVLWANTEGEASTEAAQVTALVTSLDACCVEGLTGALGGDGNIGEDPGFVDRAGADGVPGTDDDDLRLASTSPCVDTGSDGAVPREVVVDLDGNPRFTGPVDMGPYERPAARCVGDLDGDGAVDFEDLILVLSAWGACGGCAADLDGNGMVDFADLVLVLSAWGACPR